MIPSQVHCPCAQKTPPQTLILLLMHCCETGHERRMICFLLRKQENVLFFAQETVGSEWEAEHCSLHWRQAATVGLGERPP